MNWNVFIPVFVSAVTLLPVNGITCGDTEDPHDYFTSFFSNAAGTTPEYRPFYYTSLLKLYDQDGLPADNSLTGTDNRLVGEWAAYGHVTNRHDAAQLLYGTKAAVIKELALNGGRSLPPSLRKNVLAQRLAANNKGEAFRYLAFAKTVTALTDVPAWEATPPDSLALNRYMTEAADAVQKTADPFLRTRYAFQQCKLAFYNHRFADCIRLYDEHFANSDTGTAVAALALSYKGGSLYRLGKKREAAYVFSLAFAQADYHKRTNFTSFLWATDFANPALLDSYTSLCRNDREKANMIALFAMHGTAYRLDAAQTVYKLYPSSPLLPLLATREISKLEEQYFTPLLQAEDGGKALYVSWGSVNEREKEHFDRLQNGAAQAAQTAQFFEQVFNESRVLQPGLYGIAAAYLQYMLKHYEAAKALLAKAKGGISDEKLGAQAQLITLLVSANEKGVPAPEQEDLLLPSLKWLLQKAKEDPDYRVFHRNFFSQILAQRYESNHDEAKAALAYGMASAPALLRTGETEEYDAGAALRFIEEEMSTEGLLKLYAMMTRPATATEKFLVQHAAFRRDEIINVIGTGFLRDRNYAKATEWLAKAAKPVLLRQSRFTYSTGESAMVPVDPFFDYINDWQRLSKPAAVPYTKLSLAKKLLAVQAQLKTAAPGNQRARLYYQYATALYNMSHYGNSWQAVSFSRSGSSWNEGGYSLPWQKEFYGVYEAESFYQKAYDEATDRELKAASLFMVAKCNQRQIPRPLFDAGDNYEVYEKNIAAFEQQFRNNPLFEKFRAEFGRTRFYRYAYNRCSYLRDYIKNETPATRNGSRKQ